MRYLFCVVPSDAVPDLSAWRGDGAPLRAVTADGIAGIVGEVDDTRFGAEALARLSADVAALAPYARAHQEVVQFVFERAPAVVPLSFGSVHRTDDDAARTLEAQRTRVAPLLRRFRGMQEWGLRVARRRARVAVDAAVPGAGAAYLAGRRRELRGELGADASAAAADLDRRLAAASVARRVLDEDSGDLALRVAYLVPLERGDDVKRTVLESGEGLEAVGLAAELSGPWPPYSFAGDES